MCWAVWCLALLVSWARADRAQAQPSNQPGEAHYSVPFVPTFDGAWVVEGGVADSWPIADGLASTIPSLEAVAAVGWRAFLDRQGSFGLLTQLRMARAVSSARGEVWSLGGTAGLMARAFTPQYLYGGAGLLLGGDWVSWTNADAQAASDLLGGSTHASGGRMGAGVETSVGMLWHLRPYIFGEFAAQLWVERLWLGLTDQHQISARWVLRIEFGVRAAGDGAARDNLYRMEPDMR